MKEYTFAIVDKDGAVPDGAVPAVEPKLAAYQYMAQCQLMGYVTSLTVQDGKYSVAAPGLQTLTYFKG